MNGFPEPMAKPLDHEDRMRTAEERAEYEIGDPTWADVIMEAYFNPEEDHKALVAEIGRDT